MTRIKFLGIVLAAGLLTAPVSAGVINASGVLTSKADGANFDYTITLNNSSSSTDSIGTFWLSWVPGADLLPTTPLAVVTPSGWTETITNFGSTEGFGIQYVANTSAADLAPGSSLVFGFTSADTPKQLAGNSPFDSTLPALTSTLYQGGPFAGDSAQILVASVPEPSTLTLGILGSLVSLVFLRLRRKGAA